MTTGVLPDAPETVAGRRLFAINDIEFTVAEVAPHARPGGRELAVFPGDAAAVQEAFRRTRGLLTADQLESWLTGWAITADEFVAWTEAPTTTSWTGYVCSGGLDRDTAELASAAAAACALGSAPTDATSFDPSGWVARLMARDVTPEAVDAALARHRLEWTCVRGAGVFARSRAVAEELRHWVLVDGLDLAIAATQAGCPTYVVDGVLADLSPTTLRARVAGARAGELLGPVEAGPGWTLLRLDERAEPDPQDATIRARAQRSVATEVVERAVLRHVSA
ncbi:peptidylprolyl isomerase [Nocardioides marmorisolisilvae]|uniref:Uncharacterized protein n=1 Tax=Nocardioides marmorisolisilvae TaxID=1542737 RepID=A0A3N0DTN7_9ACTN|nr:peptidylprolyl isomerase [Nocardioides marmorisolisilvae]RNL78773.1 hypothetical protein EFL95_06785 [Nocardioides marmorisolisilvae]